jgi:hypothetical protein
MPAQEFYAWTFPGAPVRIHLHLNVVESLGHEVRRAFESVPSHSVEIGGILYGSADFSANRVVEVKDFEPVLCEYRPDHKFILSDADQRKLEKVLAARRADGPEPLTVVGYYRSHIGEGLSLREEDVAMAQSHFYDPANVFLLIKPSVDGSASGGFFFWDNGRIDSEFTYLEFPFEARQLTGARVKPTLWPAREKFPAAEPPAQEEPEHEWSSAGALAVPTARPFQTAEPAQGRRPRGTGWWRAVFALVMIALGALGYQAYMWWGTHQSGMPGVIVSDAPPLSLQVERKGVDLRVGWNRNSQAIAQATDGVLSIRDGDSRQQELHLDPEQLRNGSVTYTPANNAVRFRLEVTAPGNAKVSESVLALMAARPGEPASNPAHGPSPQSDAAAASSVGSGRDFGEPLRVTMVDPPTRAPGAGTPASPQPAPSAPPATEVLYLPPRAVRQVQPVLPQAVRRLIAAQVEVPVKVWISKRGRVVRTEPLPTGLVSSSLVTAAQSAAMRWRFAPAVRGTETVPSELILKFQYKPAR